MSQTELRAALADDADGLARLHDRELDAALLDALADVGFPDNLALLPGEPERAAMRAAFKQVLGNRDAAGRDALAADYAGIYLTGACGASPYESVWLTDEHLTCQLPMFELRGLYLQAGLRVDDWRKRYDDHLVLQLQYLAARLRDETVPLESIGAFLDEHLGHWLPDFANAVARRAATDFYRALALLSADWVDRCRALLEDVTGATRTPRAAMAERIRRKMALAAGDLAPLRFMPGGRPDAGPSW